MKFERYAVIGDPIDHSFSPAMQTAAFAAAGLPATYQAVRIAPGDLGTAVKGKLAGFHGFNVTIPHKQAIVNFLDHLDRSAETPGTVNTVVREGERLTGYNTDMTGFDAALDALAGGRVIRRALLFGAGGGARAVAASLNGRGIAVALSNRTPQRARDLARMIPGVIVLGSIAAVCEALEFADLVVNATSLGLGPWQDLSPLPAGAEFHPGTLAMDLVYGRETRFLQDARRAGCQTQDGIEMLVRQGVASFRIWTGLDADLEAMRSACQSGLVEVAR
ncbi:MAG: shikimate dehydrogenase [Chloroflexota bacterium]|nr:shikimate dehydrogenase [Chloroflexota bacterium]